MEILDLTALIHNTYGLIISLKDNILGLGESKLTKRD